MIHQATQDGLQLRWQLLEPGLAVSGPGGARKPWWKNGGKIWWEKMGKEDGTLIGKCGFQPVETEHLVNKYTCH